MQNIQKLYNLLSKKNPRISFECYVDKSIYFIKILRANDHAICKNFSFETADIIAQSENSWDDAVNILYNKIINAFERHSQKISQEMNESMSTLINLKSSLEQFNGFQKI